jgi:hypothetical protein
LGKYDARSSRSAHYQQAKNGIIEGIEKKATPAIKREQTVEPPDWMPFPDPRKCGFLHAPFGPGVYQIRNRKTGEYVMFGCGGKCAYRMTSLLPKPLGAGTRKNGNKAKYMLDHIGDLDYRCWAFATTKEANAKEDEVKQMGEYLFSEKRGGGRCR